MNGVIIFLAVAICFCVALFAVFKYQSRKSDKRIAEYQANLLERHYEEVENMYRQTRGWRHDYKTHIQVMKTHFQMGEYEEIGKYLNSLERDLNTVDTVLKTGNVMIDAILNSKLSLAAQKEIAVDAKAIVPKNFNGRISEIDLSIILGNLLDNAIEACQKIDEKEKRFIRVYIDIFKGQLYLYVMNASYEKLKRKGKLYESAKLEEYHGMGLIRMDKVVEKYGGYLNRQDEEGVFATEIMLPLNEKGNYFDTNR